ncbi:hypothetical protein D9M72_515010 [compost metagenome]
MAIDMTTMATMVTSRVGPLSAIASKLSMAPIRTIAVSSRTLAEKWMPERKRALGVQIVRTVAPSRMARTRASSHARPVQRHSIHSRPMAASATRQQRKRPGRMQVRREEAEENAERNVGCDLDMARNLRRSMNQSNGLFLSF